jgi:hypothetical protein
MNPMSAYAFCLRAFLYIAIAMATQASTDLASCFSGNPQEQAKFWLSVSLAGMITWRAFIDRSSTEVLSNKSVAEPVAKTNGNP